MNDRFKFRVWDIRNGEYFKDPNPTPPLNSDGTLGFTYDKANFQKYYIIEQCIGLKDKNGNLIYEGDVVKDEFGRKFKVIWSEEDCMFDGRIIYYDPEFGNRFDLYQGATDNSEIIGNIHEQAEQKD